MKKEDGIQSLDHPDFLRIETLLKNHRKEEMHMKVHGKIAQSKSKPTWLDVVPFILKINISPKDKGMYAMHFQTILSEKECREKKVSF